MSEPTTDPAETEAKDEKPEVEPIPTFASASEVPSPKPTYMVVENTFYAQTPNGELKMPLFFQTKKIRLMPEGLTLLEQVYYLVGEASPLVTALDELDMIDSREFADKLFEAYQQKQQARLGK